MALFCHKCIRQNGRRRGLCLQDVQLSVLVPDKADPYQKGGRNAAFFSDCAALMRRRISFGLLRLIHFPDKQVSVSEMVAHPRYENGTERADQK